MLCAFPLVPVCIISFGLLPPVAVASFPVKVLVGLAGDHCHCFLLIVALFPASF